MNRLSNTKFLEEVVKELTTLKRALFSVKEELCVVKIELAKVQKENILLKEENKKLKVENAILKEENKKLQGENLDLHRHLGRNSQNSNFPPSLDIFKKPQKTFTNIDKGELKKVGGQEGHKGTNLKMREKVDAGNCGKVKNN